MKELKLKQKLLKLISLKYLKIYPKMMKPNILLKRFAIGPGTRLKNLLILLLTILKLIEKKKLFLLSRFKTAFKNIFSRLLNI